ncbi:MAG: type II secretion system GspH family protein, partial [Verrucomicrobia bacterium]|nr:type II secretion system GspH family protein [Verrucomicrobiota bacterium]
MNLISDGWGIQASGRASAGDRWPGSRGLGGVGRIGFTVVELLVVIGMIAMLAGLLLPALVRAKEEGRAGLCLGNVKQFGYAWHLYAQDHDDQAPPNFGGGFGFPEGPSWVYGLMQETRPNWPDNTNVFLLQQSLLGPYLGNSPAVWRCPSDKSQALEGGRWYPRVRSFSMNGWLNGTIVPRKLKRISEIRCPPQTFVFLDEREDSIEDCAFRIDPTNGPASLVRIPGSYHNGTASLVFADGHAERHKWQDARTNPPLVPNEFVGIMFSAWPPNPDVA